MYASCNVYVHVHYTYNSCKHFTFNWKNLCTCTVDELLQFSSYFLLNKLWHTADDIMLYLPWKNFVKCFQGPTEICGSKIVGIADKIALEGIVFQLERRHWENYFERHHAGIVSSQIWSCTCTQQLQLLKDSVSWIFRLRQAFVDLVTRTCDIR